MTHTRLIRIFALGMLGLMAILAFTGCADVSHVAYCLPPEEHTYGFWGGTWHGMIMLPSFFGRLFSDDIAVYAVNNNGVPYDFGFVGGFWIMIKIILGIIKGNK